MMFSKNFMQESRNTIIEILEVIPNEKYVHAVITTKQFGRVVTRPYQINNSEWNEIILRGWI